MATLYLGARMGREWGKRKRKFSCLLFCCPMLVGETDRAEQGSAWSASK